MDDREVDQSQIDQVFAEIVTRKTNPLVQLFNLLIVLGGLLYVLLVLTAVGIWSWSTVFG